MENRVLVTTQMMIHDQDRFYSWLKELGYEADFILNDQFLTESNCLEIEPIYCGWIAGDDEITSKVIDHFCPKLKIISKWGTGIDSIDKGYAGKKGLTIKNSPGAFKDAVGELAVGYLLALVRGVVDTHIAVVAGGWPKRQYKTLVDMKIGIVGMGAIGMGVAQRLTAFGCSLAYSDPGVDNVGYEKLDLQTLFATSEAVILTCNLNSSTFHLVNEDLLEISKKGLFLINVSRGPIVDESALLRALESKRLSGVALDVYEEEPLPIQSKIKAFDNVILGSHNANNTECAVEYVHENTINQLRDFLKLNTEIERKVT